MKIFLFLFIFYLLVDCSTKSKSNSSSALLSALVSAYNKSNPANLGGCGFNQSSNLSVYYNAPITTVASTNTTFPQAISFLYNPTLLSSNAVLQATTLGIQKIYLSSQTTSIGYGAMNLSFYATNLVNCPINLAQYATANSVSTVSSFSNSLNSIILTPPSPGGNYGIFMSITTSNIPADIKVQIQ